MVKRKIVKVCFKSLDSDNLEKELMEHLTELQTKYPNLEWDFNVFGIQWTKKVVFRGCEYYDC